MTKPHEYYMSQALKLAREAADAGEVPVGCVIVRDGAVIGRGRNRREEKQAVCSHAEMEAMAQANAALGSWRLDNCALYVTLEPCPMCAGAIINSRIRRVVYGAADTKAGCCGSVTDLFAMPFNHHPVVEQGCAQRKHRSCCRRFSRICGHGLRPGRSGNRLYDRHGI